MAAWAIENDHVILVVGQFIQVTGDAAKERPRLVQRAVLGAGEFDKGRIGAAWDDVDGGPAGRLDKILRPLRADALHVFGQFVGGGVGAFFGQVIAVHDPVRLATQIAAHDAPDGVALLDLNQPHRMGQRRLRVKVDAQHPVAVQRGGIGQVLRHHGLAHAALEVRDSDADRAAIGPAGAAGTCRESAGGGAIR